jgi:RNA polymerase sigma factor (TIGR02999 family)
MSSEEKEITQMLKEWKKGDKEALDRLMPAVYDELRRIANRHLRRRQPGHTLQTTALVHEAYMKLAGAQDLNLENRVHFFNMAARIMRCILVNHAVANKTEKRGGDNIKLSLDEAIGTPEKRDFDVVALNEALIKLAALDERQSRIVELRFFAGLTSEEIAEALEISIATVTREWRIARAWLQNEIAKNNY